MLCGGHEFFKPLVSGAQQHKLHVLPAHHIVNHTGHQVKALLLRHAGHHGKEGQVAPALQSHLGLQRFLAGRLACEILAVIARGQRRIALRIEHIPVNAVEDAGKHVLPRVENAVQPLGIIGGFDLSGVAGADGIDAVGKHTAGLEKNGAAVELDVIRGIILAVHPQHILHEIEAELPLEGDVVDGQQVFCPVLKLPGVLGVGQHGQHSRVPVVAVDHVWFKAQIRQGVQHSAAEETVLLPLRIAAAIDPVAEIGFVVHQIDSHAVQLQAFDTHIFLTPAELHIEIKQVLNPVGIAFFDAAVVGGNDSCVYVELFECLGQRSHHVGETSGLGEGRTFGGGQKHPGHFASAALLEQFAKLCFHAVSSW